MADGLASTTHQQISESRQLVLLAAKPLHRLDMAASSSALISTFWRIMSRHKCPVRWHKFTGRLTRCQKQI